MNIISKNKVILFGSSTGAAAALYSAYYKRDIISGVISRGGRPDLVPLYIINNFPCYKVKSNKKNHVIPVLFIVGAKDEYVAPLNINTFLKLGQNFEFCTEENDKNNCNDYNDNSDYKINVQKIISNNFNVDYTNKNISTYQKQWRWIENATHLFEEEGKYIILKNYIFNFYNYLVWIESKIILKILQNLKI